MKLLKQTFVLKQVLESTAHSLVLTYNDGLISPKNVFEKLDIKPGKYFLEGAHSRECLRVGNMDQKISKVAKDGKIMRAIRKGFVDRENEGGDAYYSGNF